MAETNIIDFDSASSNQNFPNLEACNTYGIQDLKNLLSRSSKGRQIFIIHLDTRSLSKNISKIYELLTDIVITPDIIAISETKFNNNCNYNDIQLPGYTFVKKNSLTQAGGVGIYVKINWIYKIRSDLDFHNDHIQKIYMGRSNRC